MIVLKFGGTSVGTAESIEQIVNILKEKVENGEKIISVYSAFGGVNRYVDKDLTSGNHWKQ